MKVQFGIGSHQLSAIGDQQFTPKRVCDTLLGVLLIPATLDQILEDGADDAVSQRYKVVEPADRRPPPFVVDPPDIDDPGDVSLPVAGTDSARYATLVRFDDQRTRLVQQSDHVGFVHRLTRLPEHLGPF